MKPSLGFDVIIATLNIQYELIIFVNTHVRFVDRVTEVVNC